MSWSTYGKKHSNKTRLGSTAIMSTDISKLPTDKPYTAIQLTTNPRKSSIGEALVTLTDGFVADNDKWHKIIARRALLGNKSPVLREMTDDGEDGVYINRDYGWLRTDREQHHYDHIQSTVRLLLEADKDAQPIEEITPDWKGNFFGCSPERIVPLIKAAGDNPRIARVTIGFGTYVRVADNTGNIVGWVS